MIRLVSWNLAGRNLLGNLDGVLPLTLHSCKRPTCRAPAPPSGRARRSDDLEDGRLGHPGMAHSGDPPIRQSRARVPASDVAIEAMTGETDWVGQPPRYGHRSGRQDRRADNLHCRVRLRPVGEDREGCDFRRRSGAPHSFRPLRPDALPRPPTPHRGRGLGDILLGYGEHGRLLLQRPLRDGGRGRASGRRGRKECGAPLHQRKSHPSRSSPRGVDGHGSEGCPPVDLDVRCSNRGG